MHTDDGQAVVSHGTYREIVRPERLVFTWNSYAASETLVTIELQDLGGRTSLTLTHEMLPSVEVMQSHGDGWNGCLASLGTFLAA